MTKEDALQIAVANYLNLQYPSVLWFHPPNGGSRNAIEGAKLKRMGVLKGVSDVIILHKNNLALELKIKPNKAKPEQMDFLHRVGEMGWSTAICYDFDRAREIIDLFMKP